MHIISQHKRQAVASVVREPIHSGDGSRVSRAALAAAFSEMYLIKPVRPRCYNNAAALNQNINDETAQSMPTCLNPSGRAYLAPPGEMTAVKNRDWRRARAGRSSMRINILKPGIRRRQARVSRRSERIDALESGSSCEAEAPSIRCRTRAKDGDAGVGRPWPLIKTSSSMRSARHRHGRRPRIIVSQ